VRDYLGCDTLAYLEIDALLTATGSAASGFCTACLTGDYPVKVLGLAGAELANSDLQDELPDVDLVHPCG
jgi:glutamine phosphoribosylpyrophosphate amidotransferase